MQGYQSSRIGVYMQWNAVLIRNLMCKCHESHSENVIGNLWHVQWKNQFLIESHTQLMEESYKYKNDNFIDFKQAKFRKNNINKGDLTTNGMQSV